MKSLLTTLATLVIGFAAFAHEGHDKTPGTLTAPHGGQLKGTSQLYVELVCSVSRFRTGFVSLDRTTQTGH